MKNALPQTIGGWSVWTAPGTHESAIIQTLELFAGGVPTIGKPGSESSNVWKIHGGGRANIYGVNADGRKVCAKLFYDRRLWTRIRTACGFSKGRRAYQNGQLVVDKDVDAPAVFAYAELRPFGPSLVITELLEGMEQMNILLNDMLTAGTDLTTDPFLPRLAEAFAIFTKEMHAKEVCHNDFSPRNVLVCKDAGRMELKLIDLEDFVFTADRKKRADDIEHFLERLGRCIEGKAYDRFVERFKAVYAEEPAL